MSVEEEAAKCYNEHLARFAETKAQRQQQLGQALPTHSSTYFLRHSAHIPKNPLSNTGSSQQLQDIETTKHPSSFPLGVCANSEIPAGAALCTSTSQSTASNNSNNSSCDSEGSNGTDNSAIQQGRAAGHLHHELPLLEPSNNPSPATAMTRISISNTTETNVTGAKNVAQCMGLMVRLGKINANIDELYDRLHASIASSQLGPTADRSRRLSLDQTASLHLSLAELLTEKQSLTEVLLATPDQYFSFLDRLPQPAAQSAHHLRILSHQMSNKPLLPEQRTLTDLGQYI